MGFEPPRTVLKLDFEAPHLAGLEVSMYVPPLGEFERLTGMAAEFSGVTVESDISADQAREAMSLYETLAEYMKSWNVTRNKKPVPATIEGFRTQEISFLNTIMRSWMKAVGEVDAPLSSGSPSSPLPDLSSIPMAPLPASLAS